MELEELSNGGNALDGPLEAVELFVGSRGCQGLSFIGPCP